ncbi:DEAD/DEAH box helicase [Candidatus Nomurabacteria bacterium]|nr:DEAD/DEAH box helicase [Candidatus Nomurabacteria bacterium]
MRNQTRVKTRTVKGFGGRKSTSQSSGRFTNTSDSKRRFKKEYRKNDKPSFGGRSGFRRGSRKGGRFKGENILISRFVQKAVDIVEEKYVPQNTFADFPFAKRIHDNLSKKNFIEPTPIQDQIINHALEGKDVFGLANTGTGKTAAFLLPLIDKVGKNKNEKVIILAPTRELALQIESDFRELAYGMGIYSVACVGGMSIGKQIKDLKRTTSFIIGTPGRVKDLIERKSFDPSLYGTVVLDEADRMLDMGFRPDMDFILSRLKSKKHTLFFSATLSPGVKKMTQEFLVDPIFVSVINGETSKNVDQDIVRYNGADDRLTKLQEELRKDGSDKVLIFREMKSSVDKLSYELKDRGFKVGGIHGDKRNSQRIRILDDFKRNKINILIATDVAARGLDIPDVTHVINYDVPSTYDTYVHRIGRTGRGGKKGNALTFVENN